MSEKSEELKARAMLFATNVLRLIKQFPQDTGAQIVGRQLAKSATSIGANYRAACTARSRAEFIAKLCIVNEEADEAVYWLELTSVFLPVELLEAHKREAIELRAIFGRSLHTARLRRSMTQ